MRPSSPRVGSRELARADACARPFRGADDGPWEVIVPADPDDPAETRGIRLRSAVMFTEAELLALNGLYKSRWPSMENELKSAQALGFGRIRTRRLHLCVSRGTEGELARLQEREVTCCSGVGP